MPTNLQVKWPVTDQVVVTAPTFTVFTGVPVGRPGATLGTRQVVLTTQGSNIVAPNILNSGQQYDITGTGIAPMSLHYVQNTVAGMNRLFHFEERAVVMEMETDMEDEGVEHHGQASGGRWYRRGDKIIIVGA